MRFLLAARRSFSQQFSGPLRRRAPTAPKQGRQPRSPPSTTVGKHLLLAAAEHTLQHDRSRRTSRRWASAPVVSRVFLQWRPCDNRQSLKTYSSLILATRNKPFL